MTVERLTSGSFVMVFSPFVAPYIMPWFTVSRCWAGDRMPYQLSSREEKVLQSLVSVTRAETYFNSHSGIRLWPHLASNSIGIRIDAREPSRRRPPRLLPSGERDA